MLLLYHGTSLESCDRICKAGIDCHAGRPFVDFGQGFYTTPSLEKAKIWAEHKDTGTGCCVVEFCFDIELAQKRGMIKIFEQPDWEWAQFIMNNRIGDDYVRKMEYKVHNLNRQFHIVCGANHQATAKADSNGRSGAVERSALSVAVHVPHRRSDFFTDNQ